MKSDREFYAGVDMGSVNIKAVIVNDQRIVSSCILASGGNYTGVAKDALNRVLSQVGITYFQLAGIVVTGMGSERAPFVASRFSDITCQAIGCHCLFPSARTVIDIGGQFTKATRISARGHVRDFLTSEKCATGSGRFLQVIARILQIGLEDIGALSLESHNPVKFSTNCAVFAESEAISRLAEGALPRDILAGVHRPMASKVSILLKRLKLDPDVVLTGGAAPDTGLIAAIKAAVGLEVIVPDVARFTAAFGAACLAENQLGIPDAID
jgi:predicted CoA-substrate-specific enzyme activase